MSRQWSHVEPLDWDSGDLGDWSAEKSVLLLLNLGLYWLVTWFVGGLPPLAMIASRRMRNSPRHTAPKEAPRTS